MIVLAYAGVGLALLVGHMTCAVLASGRRTRRTDELADAWYRRKAEQRLLGLSVASEGEIRGYRRAATASRVEREAEAVAGRVWHGR